MAEGAHNPHVFGLAPGVEFPRALVEGLIERYGQLPPHAFAKIEVLVNTRRMARRLKDIFAAGPARLLPRIRIFSDIGREAVIPGLQPPVPSLRRRLELAQLVSRLLEAEPDLAPPTAAFDLADSLAALLDEMQGEDVPLEALNRIDVGDHSEHWARSLKFVSIVGEYLKSGAPSAPDPEQRQRIAVEALIANWGRSPPKFPVIIAGTTGSRGTTALLMQAVAKLPSGAVVLPGFDFDTPSAIWQTLSESLPTEDHPQYRFARFLDDMGILPEYVTPWHDTKTPAPARNGVVSLALRPAPVTNQWLEEGANLPDLQTACADLTLIEAQNERQEAAAIALLLRHAHNAGKRGALITPDRMLGRRVTAMLDRWRIEPDDSAGRPLALSAPGRFLRHVAEIRGQNVTVEQLLILLKHPLTASGGARGPHLLFTRELELWIRRNGVAFATDDALNDWANSRADEGAQTWIQWLKACLFQRDLPQRTALADHVDHLLRIAEALARGTASDGSGELWNAKAGEAAKKAMDGLAAEAGSGGEMDASMFLALLTSILNKEDVRDPVKPFADVMIWGTLEARVQGADLVILGGLNEGSWPGTPTPDPWLNRRMRAEVRLLLPDRQIGLSAHDFQQAIAAPEVVLTRAKRSGGVEPVPSRWLNRLTNLLAGLPDKNGPAALAEMRARGQIWVEAATQLDTETGSNSPELRPSPCPPVALRPKKLSVTAIQRLIRDPYAIYAAQVLRLPVVRPLRQVADASLRGTVMHDVLERFSTEAIHPGNPAARDALLSIAAEKLAKNAPWPATQKLWLARMDRVADWYLGLEAALREQSDIEATEITGQIIIGDLDFTLYGRADRIDRLHDGRLVILDYKTGAPPTSKMVTYYDKQLLLEAVIAEAGGFEGIEPETVDHVAYIGLGSSPKFEPISLQDPEKPELTTASVRAGLIRLIGAYQRENRGYTSRRAMHRMRFEGDYDHLARFGEWDDSDTPVSVTFK